LIWYPAIVATTVRITNVAIVTTVKERRTPVPREPQGASRINLFV